MIKLAYQEYGFKMSLDAIKTFKENTGKDLWFTLLRYIEEMSNAKSQNLTTLQTMVKIHSISDFETGAMALRSLLRTRNGDPVSIDDIEDGMFRVGWMPSDDGMTQPWPLVMYQIAIGVHDQFKEDAKKKEVPSSSLKQGDQKS